MTAEPILAFVARSCKTLAEAAATHDHLSRAGVNATVRERAPSMIGRLLGQGTRFVVTVAEEDVGRTKDLLEQAHA